jgi:hypothetical protein
VTYSAEVLADSPVGYWRLGESSGTNAADSSGNSRDGTYSGSPTLAQTGLLTGDADKSVSFDGSDDYVDLSNPSALRFSGSFSLEAWVKIPSGVTQQAAVIAQQYDGSGVNYILAFFNGADSSLKPSFGWYNGSWRLQRSLTSLSVDTVYHLVGTWDGSSMKIYVNAVEPSYDGATGSGAPPTSTANFRIGSRWDTAASPHKFTGFIDDVAIYSTALSQSRIQAHYDAGIGLLHATPSVVAGVGAVPAPTAAGNAAGIPAAVVGVGLVPAPTAKGTGFALPSAVAGVGSVPAPTGLGAAKGLPSAVVGAGSVPSATPVGAATGLPGAVAGVGLVPAPAAMGAGSATAQPSAVTGVGAVPAPVGKGNAATTPATVAGFSWSRATRFDDWTVLTGTPSYDSGTGEWTLAPGDSIRSPLLPMGPLWDTFFDFWTDTASTQFTPLGGFLDEVQYFQADGTTVATNNENWTGNGNAGSLALSTWTQKGWSYVGGNDVALSYFVVQNAAPYAAGTLKTRNFVYKSVPDAEGHGNATAVPAAVIGVAAIPAPTAIGGTGASASPARVIGLGAVPAPTAVAVSNGLGLPATVIGVGRVLHPEAEGEGTGGGGGTPDGATDFWSLVLAS